MKTRNAEPAIIHLARQTDLDQETAFTICQLIAIVGWEVEEDWNWDWLREEREDYRSLIRIPLLEKAWELLTRKEWLSLQTTNNVDKRISTISPLSGLASLKSLVLQNNLVRDLTPLAQMTRLTYLSLVQNRVVDLAPLRNLKSLKELHLGHNPLTSLRVLEELPNLRELGLSLDQLDAFLECQSLLNLRSLDVGTDGVVEELKRWPHMPSLKVLGIWGVRNLEGIERFEALETLDLADGTFSDLQPISRLKRLTHCALFSSQPLDAKPLAQLPALRHVAFHCPAVRGLAALSSLPALHEVDLSETVRCNAAEVTALRADLTSWDVEFKDETKAAQPSLEVQVVDQETFDYYDWKADYGLRPEECKSDGMLRSERLWLLEQIREALSVTFAEGFDSDFFLPTTTGHGRTERVVLYSLAAYDAFRDLVLAVQQILCYTRNDWIIWCQSCLDEGPDADELPDEAEDFIVWIYPDRIVTTKEHANTVRRLIGWSS